MNKEMLVTGMQHILMLKSQFVPDVGLLEGKMGIVLAFAHSYRESITAKFAYRKYC